MIDWFSPCPRTRFAVSPYSPAQLKHRPGCSSSPARDRRPRTDTGRRAGSSPQTPSRRGLRAAVEHDDERASRGQTLRDVLVHGERSGIGSEAGDLGEREEHEGQHGRRALHPVCPHARVASRGVAPRLLARANRLVADDHHVVERRGRAVRADADERAPALTGAKRRGRQVAARAFSAPFTRCSLIVYGAPSRNSELATVPFPASCHR